VSRPPVYVQIQELIRDGIRRGAFRPGDRLPSEAELSERFQTARATVARALRDLALERVITREAGRGSFVAHPSVRAPFKPTLSESFDAAIRKAHGSIDYRVLGVGRVAASADIAAGLGLPPGSEVLRLERLRLVGGRPISIVTRYLLLEIGRRITADAICRLSIHDIMAQEINQPIVHTEGFVFAGVADERTATLLQVRRGAPILIRAYSMAGADRIPVIYGESVYHEDFNVAYATMI
jgi:GntR family transcriptional regulator